MKYIIIMVMVLISCTANAERKRLKEGMGPTVQTVCIDGYLFAVGLYGSQGISIVQVFKKYNQYGKPPTPIECEDD